MRGPYAIFGYSHLFGDIVDCIDSVDGQLQAVYLNVPEVVKPGRPTLYDRVHRLGNDVRVEDINAFSGARSYFGNRLVIGFSRKQAQPLIERIESMGAWGNPIVHKTAILQTGVKVGQWSIVNAGAIIGSWAFVGRHTIVNRGANVGHDCVIRDHCFIAPSATLCSHVRLDDDVLVGAGAVVLPDVQVGESAVIAAGAVVRRNVPPFTMVAGVPAVEKKTYPGS